MTATLSPEARGDLQHIREYISKDRPQAASRLAIELVAACACLELFPERGRPGRVEGARELTTVWPYVIVYRIEGAKIEILRIWHGRQEDGR